MNEQTEPPKPTCAVKGLIAPRAMCGHIIVGLKYCGYSGNCPYKREPEKVAMEAKDE